MKLAFPQHAELTTRRRPCPPHAKEGSPHAENRSHHAETVLRHSSARGTPVSAHAESPHAEAQVMRKTMPLSASVDIDVCSQFCFNHHAPVIY